MGETTFAVGSYFYDEHLKVSGVDYLTNCLTN